MHKNLTVLVLFLNSMQKLLSLYQKLDKVQVPSVCESQAMNWGG